MRAAVLFISMLSFSLSEILGLIKGDPTVEILFKSVGVFILLFAVGNFACSLLDALGTKEPEGKQKPPPGVVDVVLGESDNKAGVPADGTAATAHDAVRKVAEENPKETARVMEALISK